MIAELPVSTDEASSPLPEDRIGAFTAVSLAADMLELREIYSGYFERVKEEAWERQTERRPTGWTMRQTIAHLGAVAYAYRQSVLAGLAGLPVELPGLNERSDLSAANAVAIEARADQSPSELVTDFLNTLSETASLVCGLEPEQLALETAVPFLSGRSTLAELVGGSLAHAGIIHGAQITATTRRTPIWLFYRPGLMRRQLTRFFHIMGRAYWPERGGDRHFTIQFNVSGQGGGSWFIRADPEGGHGQIGRVRTAELRLDFASADKLCRLLTYQISPLRAWLLRHVKIRGSWRLARDFPKFFTPT